MNAQVFDILIVGAGAAGLMAANELAAAGKSVAVLEALNRTGGRMFTITDEGSGTPVELGAEFIHGDLPLTKSLLQQAGATLHQIRGSMWNHQNGNLTEDDSNEDFNALLPNLEALETDLPVATFISRHLQEASPTIRTDLQEYVEGYYAADAKKAGSFALRDELQKGDEPQYRIEGGYGRLVSFLETGCRQQGVQFFLNSAVKQISWQQGSVEVVTAQGTFRASKILITVSLGVLQAGQIAFAPALPQQKAAAQALGFGHVVKINLLFKQPFWKNKALTEGKDLHDLQFLFSKEKISTWWSQHPLEANLLTGWLGGPKASDLQQATHQQLLQMALDALARIFALEPAYLWQCLLGAWSHNWSADPYFNGAYSYEVVDAQKYQQVLQQPVADTIYFAGEALHHGPETGTVEAALQSGKKAAEKMGAEGSPGSEVGRNESPESRESQ